MEDYEKNHMKMDDLEDRVAVVTGAGGAICGAISRGLANSGVKIAVWDLSLEAAEKTVRTIESNGGSAIGVACDVTDRGQVEDALGRTVGSLDRVDILINGAGGSRKDATTSAELSFFDMTEKGIVDTFGLNYMGTVIPCQVVGRRFADTGRGVILNIASIGGVKPLTRALGYSNAKAAVASFTEWLAVHMATEYTPAIRVNALAPGFVLTDQNRFLLVDEETGLPTERGRLIQQQVPMARYGQPQEMVGAAVWLVSDAASYVTGAVIPIDGGLLASLGV